ncbi:hypothetical protein QCA50_013758 [Cerrena zonata]|uniref:DUF6533 domain-containing protein n=1 Tax=Cerrena zonata TaxID=2478898 RepID=A0AAW0FP85_9APHY
MSGALTQSQLNEAASHLMAAKMFSLASCVMLFYDMAITFGDEVEKIWKQRITGATVLWFLNRYLSPLGYIIIIVSFHDRWPDSVCDRYILYPEILKIFTAFVIGVIFILRLYSIYSRSVPVLVTFSLLLAAELGTKIWAFTDGTRLILPPQLDGCILVGRSPSGERMVYTWAAELVFDTLVFFATLYRTIHLYRNSQGGTAQSLIRVIMRDGILYFAVIFGTNVVTVTMFVAATPDLKVVNASFSTLITSLMVSRLMLNLRRQAARTHEAVPYKFSEGSDVPSLNITPHYASKYTVAGAEPTFASTIIGNLGAPISHWGDSEDESQDSDEQHGNEARRRMETIEMGRRGQGKIAVEVTEEVMIDVEDDIHYTPRSHGLHYPKQ